MSDTEKVLGDALADGKITDDDADAVRQFAEFLQAAGPPDGGALKRLQEAGRQDLIDYALGKDAT